MEEQKIAKGKTYHFRMDTRQLVLLGSGYLFICVLVFIIGIVVGRGGASSHQTTVQRVEPSKSMGTEPASGFSSLTAESLPTEEVVVPKQEVITPKQAEELSFYRTLPEVGKGREVPLSPDQEKGANRPKRMATTSAIPEQTVPAPSAPAQTLTPPSRTMARVEPVKPAVEQREVPKPPVTQKPVKREGKLTIQVSSFRELALANNLKRKLEEKGFDVYISSVNLPDKGVWHRVQVGSYQEKAEAERVLNRIKKEENMAGLITQR